MDENAIEWSTPLTEKPLTSQMLAQCWYLSHRIFLLLYCPAPRHDCLRVRVQETDCWDYGNWQGSNWTSKSLSGTWPKHPIICPVYKICLHEGLFQSGEESNYICRKCEWGNPSPWCCPFKGRASGEGRFHFLFGTALWSQSLRKPTRGPYFPLPWMKK